MKNFKPMLAGKADLDHVVYPVMASPKIDGVRCVILNGQAMSRSLKPIPNLHVQKLFSGLPEGTDAELCLGSPSGKNVYRDTVSAVMREDGQPNVTLFVFDNYLCGGGFKTRYESIAYLNSTPNVKIVPHFVINDAEALAEFEAEMLEEGFEGIMLRDPNGKYKFGRSTTKEAILLKVKRFEDINAEIIGACPWMHNGNEATTNALGRTERSSHKAGKTALDILGKFIVRGLEEPFKDVEFEVGTGFQGADSPDGERAEMWRNREKYLGRICKVKVFKIGNYDKPRHPVWISLRDERDM